MTQKIYKYPIEIEDEVSVEMPLGAEILCVQMQGGHPCIWALVDADEVGKQVKGFIWRGTGHTMPDNHGKYVGTVQLHGGSLIFHLFEA